MPGTARLEAYFQALTSGNRQVFRDLCASVMFRTSEVADGASAVAHYLDTSAAYTTPGAKLLSLRNATVEKFSVGYDGQVTIVGEQGHATLSITHAGYEGFRVDGNATYIGLNAIGANSALAFGNTYVMLTRETHTLALYGYDGIKFGLSSDASTPLAISSAGRVALTQTWNSGLTTFKALTVDITDTASASGSLLMDLMVGGTSKVWARKDGAFKATSLLLGANLACWDTTTGNLQLHRDANGIGWSDGDASLGNAGWSLVLYKEAANVLAQRNGTNAQAYRLYNDFTDTGNYSRLELRWTGNYAYVMTHALGTGVSNGLVLGTANDSGMYLQTGGSTRWQITNVGHLIAGADGAYDIGASGANRPRALYLGGNTVTASAPVLNLTQTWNSGGTTFTGIYANFTSTASASGSLLIDLQVDAASKFKVEKDGRVYTPYISFASAIVASDVGAGGTTTGAVLQYATSGVYGGVRAGLSLGSGGFVAWDSAAFPTSGSPDVAFYRNAAGVIEVNNGTAGTYRDLIARNLELTGSLAIGDGALSYAINLANNSGGIEFSNAFVKLDRLNNALTLTGYAGVTIYDSSGGANPTMFRLGGVTSSFPALKRNSGDLQCRLADDSGYANFYAGYLVGSTGLYVPTRTTTTSAPVIDLAQTWNAGAVTFTGILANFTDTASASASLLMDLQVGGTSKFSVGKGGHIAAPAGTITAPSIRFGGGPGWWSPDAQTIALSTGNASETYFRVGENAAVGVLIYQALNIGWSDGFGSTTKDTGLSRNAAGVVEINNGTAGTYRDLMARNITLSGTLTAIDNCGIKFATANGFAYQQYGVQVHNGTLNNYAYVFSHGFVVSNGSTYGVMITHSDNELWGGVNGGLTFSAGRSISWDSSTSAANGTRDLTLSRAAAGSLLLSGTWNAGATTFTAFKVNTTDTASAAASLLMDLQVGGVSKFSVGKGGNAYAAVGTVSAPGWSFVGAANYGLYLEQGNQLAGTVNGVTAWACSYYGFQLSLISIFGWATAPGNYGIDTALTRNAAGIVEINNGTAGTFRDLTLRNIVGQTGYTELIEMTAPSAPAANTVRLYAEDNGAGKTRLMALFPSGAAQQVAIEP